MWLYERVWLNTVLMVGLVLVWVAASGSFLVWLNKRPNPNTEEE